MKINSLQKKMKFRNLCFGYLENKNRSAYFFAVAALQTPKLPIKI